MNGNIVTDRLVINEGGIFSGQVTRKDGVKDEPKILENSKFEEGSFMSKLRDLDRNT